MATPRTLDAVDVEDVVVPKRHRTVNEETVASLAASMSDDGIGLQTPITVQLCDGLEIDGYTTNGVPVLVTGAHRLAAAKRLGWQKLDCFIVEYRDEAEAELWEIDENLCRQELSQAEYSAHVARRKELYERLHPETRPVTERGGPGRGRNGRQDGDGLADRFTADTAAKTGKSERSVQRAAQRGSNIAEDILSRIQGTRLDTGKYQDELAKLDDAAQREKVKADLAQPASSAQSSASASAPKRRQQQAEDRDLSEDAADQVARVLAEYVPGEHWDGVKANLHKCRGKQVAQAMDRLTGVAVFDNTRGGEAA